LRAGTRALDSAPLDTRILRRRALGWAGETQLAINVKIFSGNSNRPLAQAICQSINLELGRCTVSAFPDGETFVKIEENVRGQDTYVIQSSGRRATST